MGYRVIIRGYNVGVRITKVLAMFQEKQTSRFEIVRKWLTMLVEQNRTGPFYHSKDGRKNPLFRLKIKSKVLKKNSLL